MDLFMRYAVELAIIISDAFFIFLPVTKDLRWRPRFIWSMSGILLPSFILLSAWAGAARLWPIIPTLVLNVSFLFLVFFFSVRLSPGKKLFCFFNAIMLGAFCLLYSIVITVPYEEKNELWASVRLLSLRAGVTALGLSLIVGLVFFWTLTVELPTLLREERVSNMWDFLFIIPFAALLLIGWMTPLHPQILLIGRSRSFLLVLLPLIPLMLLLFYHLLWWTVTKFSESAKLQQENTFLQMEGKRYEALRSYMGETRAIRHDFHNHLLVIKDFARSGEMEKLLEYLSPLTETEERYVKYSANRAVDAVAAHYAALAEAHQTLVDWNLQIPAHIPIREMDYCAMLGNLLENALRAVSTLPPEQRHISVISSMLSDNMLGLAMDNPFSGEIIFDKNRLPHSGRKGHGIGLVSVMNTVRRYGGSMNIKTENGVFSVEILLYSTAEQEKTKKTQNEPEMQNSKVREVFLL
ncbi:MAG: GHKL domain-containing protein [Fretibacterium sp.]|nr:GHKL domain-containing protein [Fretibacterium sp.]